MQEFTGVGVSPGRVIGPVKSMAAPAGEPAAGQQLPRGVAAADAAETLQAAARAVQDELRRRADTASGDAKAVLQATSMMAADPLLLKSAIKLINAGTGPERAIWEAGAAVAQMLRNLGGYMAERTTDVLDVRSRILAELRGLPAPGIPVSDEPFVLVAEDLAPADAAILDTSLVRALITSGGGPQSHTAIIARSLGLPAVVAARGVQALQDGVVVYVDGTAGTIRTDPGRAEQDAAEAFATAAAGSEAFDGTGTTADGHQVPLLANVGGAKDAAAAAAAGAQGVGLLRTEFCFLGRDSEPSVEEQVLAYRSVFAAFPGKKVIVRTLDAGADKPLPFLTDSTEPNPALGVRGYRTDATSPGVLKRQLQAIAEAAGDSTAEVWVMAPMISTAQEAAAFAGQCAEAGLATSGVMMEVPSAALSSEAILREVSFGSLGTNDLTQYTMAADRQLGALAALNDSWQPALLRLVQLSVEGARAAGDGKPVGVCGEAAADPALAVVLLGLGVSTLSMTARALAGVGAVLKSVTLAQAQELAEVALAAPTAKQARELVRARLPVLDALGL